MRQEVVVTPEVLAEDGITVVTPVVMNVAPTTVTALREMVRPDFIADFPALFINNVVSEMMSWSKYDGTGTFSFYAKEIVK